MADEPFIDTHIHFWDHAAPGLEWAWLRRGFTYRRWEAAEGLDAPRYAAEEFRDESRGAGVAALVHGHSADPIDDPAVETAWLDAMAHEHGIPDAIVGRCSLADPGAPELLARHNASIRFRGVRDPDAVSHLDVAAVARGMDAASALGMSVEMRRDHEAFGELHTLADRWPDVTLALSHACLPLERTEEQRRTWAAAMRSLARHANVVCKISAVAGASDPDWTVDSIRPWILTCVDTFGPDRCMLGSNWPVDRRFGTYAGLVDAYREVLSELEPGDRADVLHGTARRVYRLTS